MKAKLLVGALMILPIIAMAANNFDDEVNSELDKMYAQTKSNSAVNSTELPAAAVQVNVNQGQEQAQNQLQMQAPAQPQKQPTTVIEASPLTESRADRIRKARQDAEIQTEQKIVEKLEFSRMEDERRRGEVLFGDRFGQLTNANQPQPAPVIVAPVPVQEVAPAPIVHAPQEDKMDKDAVRAEISAALSDMKPQEEKHEDKMYFAGLLGVGDYPDAKNLKGQYATGFAVGKTFAGHTQIEGAFIYSSYQVEQVCSYFYPCGGFYGGQYYPTITKMDQYQGSLTGKYQAFSGVIRPVIGASVAYTYRSFTDTQFARYNSDATSTALDLGLVTGADFVLSDSFSLGLDFRYYINVTSQSSGQFQRSFLNPQEPGRKPVEQLNYYTLGIVGRTSF
jgi:outer membrane protein W